jgi:hypothetical protein
VIDRRTVRSASVWLVPESLFSRATRYTRSPSLDPHENRLTEITAAVLEHVDGLAQKIAEALLRAACDHASQALAEGNDASSAAWRSELQRRQMILDAWAQRPADSRSVL